MSRSSEAQRERDVQRYFQSWQSAQGSSLNVALNVDSIAEPDLRGSGYVPKPSRDKALTAFAQLAVLRLGVKRAMVSLIDDSTQFILAEATRSLKLADDTAPKPARDPNSKADNELWLGSTLLSRPDAVCEHAMFNTCTSTDKPGGQAFMIPGLVIPDCRLDSRFKTRPYVVAEAGVRFYAGVPIYSPGGHKIGAYAVSDPSPRDGLTADELEFMQGVAQAVMEHLEWARDRVDRFKGERIVRGLASFIEGCSAAAEDPRLAGEEDGKARSHSGVRPPEMNISTVNRPLSPPRARGETPPPPKSPSVRPGHASSRPAAHSPPPLKQPQPAQAKQDTMLRMYGRAADILRNATLADGVALFGATASTRKLSERDSSSLRMPSPDNQDGSMSESIGIDSSDSDATSAGRPCSLLAYSLADAQARADITQGPVISLKTLEKYYHMFPRGKTFSFTTEGAGVSSEDDSHTDQEVRSPSTHAPAKRRRLKIDHTELLKRIPGAKVVVFVPLYDYAEDRFAGGCFLWTSITGRIMNLDDDLAHLRAFGNSIMNQVGRINTQRNEAAKTTFIASMSHELRSPLHGILGAVEFLKDTQTDLYQSGLINSIFSCGQTLLDTLNHVLDYSKINRLGRTRLRRAAKSNRRANASSDTLESLNITAVVNLAVLVEEVVDAVSAGHTFKNMPASQDNSSEGSVAVALDICPATAWTVRTQPGALRRIVMNLFGNALKYTANGNITISLHGQANEDGSKVDVVLRVIDTGKGMSEEFQRDRLFIPFSQEDAFQPGTGLGLSIVKQIVDSLGGTLEVKSKQSSGTEVSVRLRLKSATEEPDRPPPEVDIVDIARKTKGLRLTILDGRSDLKTGPTQRQIRKLNEILEITCSRWFGMTVSNEMNPEKPETDIYLFCEPPPMQSMEQRFRDAGQLSANVSAPPIVAVCLNAEEAVRISKRYIHGQQESEIIGVISQPCGPRKLAKVFSQCLQRFETRKGQPERKSSPPAALKSTEGSGLELERSRKGARSRTSIKRQTSRSSSGSPTAKEKPLNKPLILSSRMAEQQDTSGPNGSKDKPKRPFKVLLVDDNKINLQLLVMFMKKCGYDYKEAENGREAVERYQDAAAQLGDETPRRPAFDYVLMDVNMPVLNGLEATKQIRQHEREHGLPPANVFALTGLASSEARRDANSAGVDVFLPKPVRFAELKKLFPSG